MLTGRLLPELGRQDRLLPLKLPIPARIPLLYVILGVLLLGGVVVSRRMCISAYFAYGLDVGVCPDGRFHQAAWAAPSAS